MFIPIIGHSIQGQLDIHLNAVHVYLGVSHSESEAQPLSPVLQRPTMLGGKRLGTYRPLQRILNTKTVMEVPEASPTLRGWRGEGREGKKHFLGCSTPATTRSKCGDRLPMLPCEWGQQKSLAWGGGHSPDSQLPVSNPRLVALPAPPPP